MLEIAEELAKLRADELAVASHFGWDSKEAQALAKQIREMEIFYHQLLEMACDE